MPLQWLGHLSDTAIDNMIGRIQSQIEPQHTCLPVQSGAPCQQLFIDKNSLNTRIVVIP